MKRDDEVIAVAGDTGTEQPPSTEVLEILNDGFIAAARKGEYKATALVADVRVTLPHSGEKSDAISVSLDHLDHYSIVVIVPYKLDHEQLTLGETYAERAEQDVFVSDNYRRSN
jgi:hypothetical protein